MPLPKAPGVPGDILEDYGPAAAVRKTRKKKSSTEPVSEAKPVEPAAAEMTPAVKPAGRKTSRSKTARTAQRASGTQKADAPQKSARPAKRAKPAKAAPALSTAAPASAAPAAGKEKMADGSAVHTGSVDDMLLPIRGASSRLSRRAPLKEGPKLFVLDTNVLMHDPLCLFRFEEHDVFIPMIVLEELDNHKTGTTDVSRNARSVSRSLDQLTELHHAGLDEGIPLSLLGNSEATGRLFIETHPIFAELPSELPLSKADNLILATAKGAEKVYPNRTIVLVSKDINMRIKAAVLGIATEDYLSDKVIDDTEMIYAGRTVLPVDFWMQVEDSLKVTQSADGTVYSFEWPDAQSLVINECLTVEGDAGFMAAVTRVDGLRVEARVLKDYEKRLKVWGIHARNAEQNMALNLLMDPNIDFVSILGQAGTGKTLLTLAAALTQTLDQNRFSEIIITRATVSVGDDIGYLPGTEEEKMAPWMGALEDNLEVLQSFDTTSGDWAKKAGMDLLKNRIRIKSMSFMRGRTFLKKFVIIDEAQNLSPKQMKTLITRAGPGTKIVCLGNLAQIDTPYLTEGSSGLTYVVDRFKNWSHAATLTLTRGERSRLADYAVDVL